MSLEITCPSGLRGIIRPFDIGDINACLSKALRSKNGPVLEFKIASLVWTETLDTGPYTFDGVPPWDGDILTGDRFWVLMQSRIAARGPIYSFEHRCAGPGCSALITKDVDLNTDLPLKALAKSDHEKVRAGNRFSFRLPDCGRSITYALPTGRTQRRLASMLEDDRDIGLFLSFAARLLEVEALEPRQFIEWAKRMSFVDYEAMTREMEDHDCGVDTAVEIECEECGYVQSAEVNFSLGFFTPERRRNKKRSSPSSSGSETSPSTEGSSVP